MKKPNILIVMTDHQRADTTLPEHPAKTPNLDKFSSEAVTFTQTFCPTAHCCPARATFMSGLYPSGHGIWNNVLNDMALNTDLNEGVKLWSEDLADAGYKLYYAGKWHVCRNENPKNRGWEELLASSVKGELHGFLWDKYKEIHDEEKNVKERGEGQILKPGYGDLTLYGSNERGPEDHDERVTELTSQKISELSDASDPWCMFAGLIGPHDPYIVPQKFIDMYNLDDIKLPESFKDTLEDKPYVYKRMRNKIYDQLTERETRKAIRHFYAYCTYLDDCFGRIYKALEESGQADNTIVIYTADHGDYCGDHGLFAKGVPAFKGAYNVPAIIRWPQGVKNPGRQVEEFISLADFAPTFLELAECKTDRHFTGASITPFLKDEKPADWRDTIFTQLNGVELYYSQRTVRTKEFRYTYNGFDRDELYDLKNDPDEMKNLADNPEYEGIKHELVRSMWKFAKKENDPMTNSYVTVSLCPWGPAEAFAEE
jgi:choline-sulfatase